MQKQIMQKKEKKKDVRICKHSAFENTTFHSDFDNH